MVVQPLLKVGNTVLYIRTNEYGNLIRPHSSVDVWGVERWYWKVKWFNKRLLNDECYYSETLLRLATEEEIKHYQELKDREEYAMRYL